MYVCMCIHVYVHRYAHVHNMCKEARKCDANHLDWINGGVMTHLKCGWLHFMG